MAIKTQIKRIQTAKKKYNEALSKLGRKAIAKALGEVIPKGFALTWSQYTPGFNDGEPCTFRLGEVHLVTVKAVGEVEAVEVDEPEEIAAEPTATGDVAAPEDVAAAELDEDDESAADEEGAEEVELKSEERDFDSDDEDEDEGMTSLEYGKASDLKWAGMTAKDFAAIRATWNLVKDKTILEKAFGDDRRIVVRSGGKFSVDQYDCGY